MIESVSERRAASLIASVQTVAVCGGSVLAVAMVAMLESESLPSCW
jgi:hypothetical protein